MSVCMPHLALPALGVQPALGLHGIGHTHQVLLHDLVRHLVQALLLQVNLLAGCHHRGVHGVAAAAWNKDKGPRQPEALSRQAEGATW